MNTSFKKKKYSLPSIHIAEPADSNDSHQSDHLVESTSNSTAASHDESTLKTGGVLSRRHISKLPVKPGSSVAFVSTTSKPAISGPKGDASSKPSHHGVKPLIPDGIGRSDGLRHRPMKDASCSTSATSIQSIARNVPTPLTSHLYNATTVPPIARPVHQTGGKALEAVTSTQASIAGFGSVSRSTKNGKRSVLQLQGELEESAKSTCNHDELEAEHAEIERVLHRDAAISLSQATTTSDTVAGTSSSSIAFPLVPQQSDNAAGTSLEVSQKGTARLTSTQLNTFLATLDPLTMRELRDKIHYLDFLDALKLAHEILEPYKRRPPPDETHLYGPLGIILDSLFHSSDGFVPGPQPYIYRPSQVTR